MTSYHISIVLLVDKYFKKHIPHVDFQDIFKQQITENIMYSEPIFVKTFVKGVDRKGQLIINGLRAGKKYDI